MKKTDWDAYPKNITVPKPLKQHYKTEDALQIAVAQYLDAKGFIWFHPANERKTETRVNKKGQRYSPTGNKLKAKGVKKGIPDVIILDPRIVIELKVGKNTLTSEQSAWILKFRSCGWDAYVCRTLDDVMAIFEGKLKRAGKE